MENKEELQRKILEFQILESELKVIDEREGNLLRNLEDLNNTRTAIEDLKSAKPDTALVPLGSGNFVHGKVTDSDNIIVGIGANIAARRTKEQAIELIDERIRNVEQISETLAAQAQSIFTKMRNLQVEIEKAQK
jgi:prefoldin alpha subunit